MQLHKPALRTLAAAFALAAITATPARAGSSPFGQAALDAVLNAGGEPSDLTFNGNQLVWNIQNYGVFQIADLSSAGNYTVVLVRSTSSVWTPATGKVTDNKPGIEVTQDGDKWVLANGLVSAIGTYSYNGTDYVSTDFEAGAYTEGMDRFNDGDMHMAQKVTNNEAVSNGKVDVVNYGLWTDVAHETATTQEVLPAPHYAYPYYMLVFETSQSGGMINGDAVYMGYFDEELNPTLPDVDSSILKNSEGGANLSSLVVRFGGDGEGGPNSNWHKYNPATVPEPATAALFLFGAALLARRRRD